MVMGSRRHSPETVSHFSASARLLFSLLLLLLFVIHVDSRVTRCRVDECSQKYDRANRRLQAKEHRLTPVEWKHKRCHILDRLRRCLQRTRRSCIGNLLFHSIKHISVKNLQSENCTMHRVPNPSSPDLLTSTIGADAKAALGNATAQPEAVDPEVEDACAFVDEPTYKHCGMFGDPHLRTFSDQFYTCNVAKAWPLVENDYMVVMATNVPVREGSKATVTTKITVLIKSHKNCAEQRFYAATSDRLPSAFVDGSTSTKSVFVVEVVPGEHVEIQAHFIATKIIVRRVARYLTFAIRMPDQLIAKLDYEQLCVSGCPVSQQLVKPEQSALGDPGQVKRKSKRSPPADFLFEYDDSNTGKHISKEDAERLCRRVVLGSTPTEAESENQALEPAADDVKDQIDKPKLTASLSSVAFSSLIPSSGRNDRHRSGKKRSKTSDSTALLYRRLRGSQASGEAAILSSARSTKRERRRKRKKKKAKRDVSTTQVPKTLRKPKCSPDANGQMENFNFYFESCVFDLFTTGDVNFTLVAKAALDDVIQTHVLGLQAPGTSMYHVTRREHPTEEGCQRTQGEADSGGGGGGGTSAARSAASIVALCSTIACVCVNLTTILFVSSRNTVSSKSWNPVSARSAQKRTKHLFKAVALT